MAQYYDRQGKTIGSFVLPVDVPAILPRIPQVPFGFMDVDTGLPLVCGTYEMRFWDSEAEKLFAVMDYDAFLDRVDASKCERYDGDCFLVQGLSMEEMKRIAGIEE
jgi:hypothetical protein